MNDTPYGSLKARLFRKIGLALGWVSLAVASPSVLPLAIGTWFYDRGSYDVTEGHLKPLPFWKCLKASWLVVISARPDVT